MALLAKATSFAHLAWDSDHFGFRVGRIAGDVGDDELRETLVRAQNEGYRLVYWATSADRVAPPDLLARFRGRLVDRKVTFTRNLPTEAEAVARSEAVVHPWTSTTPSPELVSLAIAAGVYSRFGVDPLIPRRKFEQLYRIWIERSVRHEIADAVLVAYDAERGGSDGRAKSNKPLAGMITLSVSDAIGNIGLIAVAETHRGQGIGSLLMAAAHRWMTVSGAVKSTVVTQGANSPACRLYERTGYTLEHADNYYHFWL